MKPAQCRAARALLDITQPQLAKAAGLHLSTIVAFEGSHNVSVEVRARIGAALEAAGVDLIYENGGGLGVRLRTGAKKG